MASGNTATRSRKVVPSDFRRDGFHDRKSPIGFWQPSSVPDLGHYPYVACNSSGKTELYGERDTPRG
jgi:hypothetical protein